MANTSLQIRDVYALQEKETGKWFAFQIVELGEDYAVCIDMDYWSEMVPTEQDLNKMSYFRLNHHLWDNKICQYSASTKYFPSHAQKVGNIDVRPFEEFKIFDNWPNGKQHKLTEKWEKLPKDQVSAFKEALTKRNETIMVAGKEVKKNLYGIFDDTLSAVKDFSEFDILPGLGRITATKDYPQLIPFIERRCLIRELIWDNCQHRELDLSRTHLEEVEISGECIESILLPSSIISLTLRGILSPNLRIHSPKDGYFMVLRVELQDDSLPDVGLSRLTNLVLSNIKNFNLKDIPSRFPGLVWLGLAGHPGYIRDVAEISNLHELETLTIDDLFGFSADDFPLPKSFPQLRNLWIESIPAEAGKVIKKLYKGKIQDLLVLKLRSDEWLHENLNNPLRHWDGSEFVPKSKYIKSVALWKDARRRMIEETNHPELDLSAVKRIAIDYVEGFNQLDCRSSFIETEEREDIFNAFEQILNETGLSEFKEEIIQLIDEKRSW